MAAVGPINPRISDGDTGTSAEFVALIIVSATCPSLIRNLLAVLYPESVLFNNKSFWVTLIFEFCIIVLPVELMITLWNVQSHYFLLVTWCGIFLVLASALCTRRYRDALKSTSFLKAPMSNCTFVSYFRAYTNIFTGFSILAVDFTIYPSYFYKSRVYGTALMDSGLGFYIISNAIVSAEARGIETTKSAKAALKKATKDTIPLICLGVGRYFLLTSLDYHVPIQEYGVHWNFFFTLAVVKMGSTLLFSFTPTYLWKFLGPLVILLHQSLLLTQKYRYFVLFGYHGDAARTGGFIEANREGIVASIGFLAIYFVGVQLGTLLMKKRENIGDWSIILLILTVVCSTCWIMLEVTGEIVQKPSRKFSNLSYMFFVIGVTSLLIVEGLAFDILITYIKQLACTSTPPLEKTNGSKDRTCSLLQGINYNGLLFFAVANLMTGIVNLNIDSKTKSSTDAFAIVTAYMMILSVLFLYMYRQKLSFKAILWRKKPKSISEPRLAETNIVRLRPASLPY